MEITKPLKHIGNVILAIILIFLFGILLMTTIFGFLQVLPAFDNGNEGMVLFLSFIVLSFTLSILCHTILSNCNTTNETYDKIARNFTISGILMFIVYVSIKGLDLTFSQTQFPWIKPTTLFLLTMILFYVIINFIFSLFLLLLEQTGLRERFTKSLVEAKEWYIGLKNKKGIALAILVLYTILITIYAFREYLFR